MKELADLEARAGIPPRTRRQAIDEANRRRAPYGLPPLNPKTVSDWFNHGSPARDFKDLWALVEVMMEWTEPHSQPARRSLASVRQKYQLRWNDARNEQPPPNPPATTLHSHAKPEPPQLAQMLLSVDGLRSVEISDTLVPSLATASRAKNRTGWKLLAPRSSGLRAGGANWPISHRGHRVGHLIWHDGHTPRWEFAMHDISLGEEPGCYVVWYPCRSSKRYGVPHGWADPADALATLAKRLHYCPRDALTVLFSKVEGGMSASKASQAVNISVSTAEMLVRDAKRVRDRTGRPLLDQVDDLLRVQTTSDIRAGNFGN